MPSRLGTALLAWVGLVAAMAWVLVALRLSREDVAGIEAPGGAIALIQFVLAALGALGAVEGAMRTRWYVRTGREGPEAAAAFGGAALLLGVWALLVLPGW